MNVEQQLQPLFGNTHQIGFPSRYDLFIGKVGLLRDLSNLVAKIRKRNLSTLERGKHTTLDVGAEIGTNVKAETVESRNARFFLQIDDDSAKIKEQLHFSRVCRVCHWDALCRAQAQKRTCPFRPPPQRRYRRGFP